MRINLGDIVTMPLPTEWSPDVQYDPINFPAGPPTLAQPPNASLNVQSAPGNYQQVATGPTGPFPNIPPAVANAGSFGYPGADEVFGSDGGGGVRIRGHVRPSCPMPFFRRPCNGPTPASSGYHGSRTSLTMLLCGRRGSGHGSKSTEALKAAAVSRNSVLRSTMSIQL